MAAVCSVLLVADVRPAKANKTGSLRDSEHKLSHCLLSITVNHYKDDRPRI